MKDGFIKVAAASVDIRVADCGYNKTAIIEKAREAAALGVKVLVLPELCVTGYTCGDLFSQKTLLDAAGAAVNEIASMTTGLDMVFTVGLPLRHHGKLYNCAAVLHAGRVLGFVPKSHIPMYNEFYEGRNFDAAPAETSTIRFFGQEVPFGTHLLFEAANLPECIFGVEICEDLWAPCPPCISLAAAGATLILNPSASNETIGKREYRREMVKSMSARLLCGYLYASAGAGESTTDMVFGGHCILAENDAILDETSLFKPGMAISEVDLSRLCSERRRMTTYPAAESSGFSVVRFNFRIEKTLLTRFVPSRPFVPADGKNRAERCELILSMQVEGLRKRLQHTKAASAVVGLSGGLDSTLALLVAVRAMRALCRPMKDITAVTMPCFGTTNRTKNNATTLAEALGVTLLTIDITAAVRQHLADIALPESDRSVAFENAQARERTQVLMDIANKDGGMVIGTGDLSELALGWATYNGDHMSMYAVNAGVPKTLVRHIVRYAADTAEEEALRAVLLDILNTPVSPELLPPEGGEISQKTEDLVGPYELHDFFLYNGIRWGFPPAKVLRLAEYAFGEEYDRQTILSWLKVFYHRFFAQQFKRSCLPDGPKIGSVTLSPRGDWRMPSDACATLWLEEIERL